MRRDKDIEKSFGDRFSPSEVRNEGWNEPSDSIWDRIETDLTRETNTDSHFTKYILLTLLLLSMLAGGYQYVINKDLTKEIESVRNSLEVCEGTVQEMPVKGKNTNSDFIPPLSQDLKGEHIHVAAIQSPPISNVVTSTTKTDDSPAIHEEAKSSVGSNTEAHALLSEKILDAPRTEADKIMTAGHSPRVPLPVQIERDILTTSSLPRLKREIAPYFTERIDLPAITKPLSTTPIATSRNIWQLSAAYMPNGLHTTGSHMTDLSELIDREYGSYRIGLQLSWQRQIMSNISIGAGLGLSKSKFVTEYDLTLPYDISAETADANGGHIDFEHSLPTSFGKTETAITLTRRDLSASLAQSDVVIDYNTNHEFWTIEAPIEINYHFVDMDRGPYLGSRFIGTKIISSKAGIESVISHHDQVEATRSASHSEYTDLQKYNLSVGVHAGYRWSVGAGGLGMDVSYQRGLQSYFDQEDFSSRAEGLRLTAGYFMRF